MRLSRLLCVLAATCAATGPALAQHAPSPGANFPAALKSAMQQEPDFLEYGDPSWVARLQARRDARLTGTTFKAATDSFRVPVLLGGYSGMPGGVPLEAFDDMLFGEAYPTGSMRAFYDEVSYGQFDLDGEVFGWYQAPQPQAYYQGNGNGYGGTFPQNARGFVAHIVAEADPTVDFSQFDNDGPDGVPNSGDDDGFVDVVMVVYAGTGPDWGGGGDNIWPHQSFLYSNATATNDPSANGGMIQVSRYVVAPERYGPGSGQGDPSRVRPMGVFAHEFGHVLGLPDLYDRTDASEGPDFQSSAGFGEWGLMASGSWGGDGSHPDYPSHMAAWSKIQMGWLTPRLIEGDVTAEPLRSLAEHPDVAMMWEDGYQGSRYFLLENRQQDGFDTYLNGSGMLITHIDENARWGPYAYSRGTVNDDETRKLVDVEEADGLANLDNNQNRGDAGDLFPGTSGNTAFTGTTSPNSNDYDLEASGVAVTNISASGPTMTFDAVARQPLGSLVAYDEQGVSGWGWGFQDPQDIWGGVLFTASESGSLAAVDVGVRRDGVSYEVHVFPSIPSGGPEGEPTPALVTVSGQADVSGWHTVALPESSDLDVEAGESIFVAVKVIGQAYGLSYDRFGERSGHSYTSSDGVSWSNNISTSDGGGDINVRARLKRATPTSGESGPVASGLVLLPVRPNPAIGRASVVFETPEAQAVTVRAYDVLGRTVATLADGRAAAGQTRIEWDLARVSSGVYVVEVVAGGERRTQKVVVGGAR